MDIQKLVNSLQEQIGRMQSQINDLAGLVNKNSFSSSQVFNKDVSFTGRLKVPHFDSAPTVSEVGDIIEVGGKLYICTVANTTFTLVGTQT